MDESKMPIIQAFVTNIAAPKTLKELEWQIDNSGFFVIDDLLYGGSETAWTVPRWAKIGDIVFFMHSKTSDQNLRGIRAEIRKNADCLYDSAKYLFNMWLNRGMKLHEVYGGTIFAIGIVCGAPYYEDADSERDEVIHWKSRIYAKINHVTLLKKPIHISEFNDIVTISRQSAITGVFGEAYTELMNRIMRNNDLPVCFRDKVAAEMPLTKISANNWLDITAEYRHAFFLEAQFRAYYVDYLLRELGDQKKFYAECRTKRKGYADAFVDNLILFHGKWLPVEVKLNIDLEKDLIGQLHRYVHTDGIYADNRFVEPKQLWNNNVLVIDTDNIYVYESDYDDFITVYSLLDVKTVDDVRTICDDITNWLSD